MATACGTRLSLPGLQEQRLHACGGGGDVRPGRVASSVSFGGASRPGSCSQHHHGLRKISTALCARLTSSSAIVEESRSSYAQNPRCQSKESKLQTAKAVGTTLNATSLLSHFTHLLMTTWDEDTSWKDYPPKPFTRTGVERELPGIDWDNFGFGLRPTDFMYVMKCDLAGNWRKGELQPYGNLEISPCAGVLNYGQGLFEGLKAYRSEDGRILLFRPEENAARMRSGAERMSMPAPDADAFVNAVKQIVLANKRWIPPSGKGSLYIRPLLIGTGAVLGLAPAPEYTFLIYVSPVGTYFKGGLAPIDLKVETYFHRAAPGGTGGVKTISNYAPVLKTQLSAKAKGYSDVLYLDAVENKYVEEVSSCNIFMVKDNVISTPELKGTILPGVTRKSIIELARSRGYEVHERPVDVVELLTADEVFCTGTAVVLNPVGSITYGTRRFKYNAGAVGAVSQELYTALTSLQMGLSQEKSEWVVELN